MKGETLLETRFQVFEVHKMVHKIVKNETPSNLFNHPPHIPHITLKLHL